MVVDHCLLLKQYQCLSILSFWFVECPEQLQELQQSSCEFRLLQPLYVIPGLLSVVEVWTLEWGGGGVEWGKCALPSVAELLVLLVAEDSSFMLWLYIWGAAGYIWDLLRCPNWFHSLEFLNRNTKSESSNPIYYTQIGAPATLAVLIIKTMTLIGLSNLNLTDIYLATILLMSISVSLQQLVR